MNAPPNIYSIVHFDLKPKIAQFIKDLDERGQIDLDDNGYPYLLKMDCKGSNHMCHIVRNGKAENFVMNTRKRKEPLCSWNESDGYVRKGGKKVITVVAPEGGEHRGERAKRTVEAAYCRLTDQLLKG